VAVDYIICLLLSSAVRPGKDFSWLFLMASMRVACGGEIGIDDDVLPIWPWWMCDGHGSCILLGHTFGHRYLGRLVVSSHVSKAI